MYLKGLSSELVLSSSLEASKKMAVLSEIEHHHAKIYEGQFLDVSYHSKDVQDVSIEDYLHMISLTTGVQFAGCLRVGAVLSDVDPASLDPIAEIGQSFGVLGQIRDDLIDYIMDEDYTWKTPLLDFRKNKKRLPLIVAWQNANESEKKKLTCYQSQRELAKEDYLELIGIVMKPNNLEIIRRIMEERFCKAEERLHALSSKHEGKNILRMLFNIVMES
jgi:geranylgeranyl pyrophosphate synthase